MGKNQGSTGVTPEGSEPQVVEDEVTVVPDGGASGVCYGAPGNAVHTAGQAMVQKAPATASPQEITRATDSRKAVAAVLGATGTTPKLRAVAETLGVLDSVARPVETAILNSIPAGEQAAVTTAVLDALKLDRDIEYVCGVQDPTAVNVVHFHIHSDSAKTTVEIMPGPAHP